LLARKDGRRVLVQVKGTTTGEGKFGTPPKRARGLAGIAQALDCYSLYAFCQFTATGPLIRFSDSTTVIRLAEQNEADYEGTNRFHVLLEHFSVESGQIDTLLTGTTEKI
jgi:hypothetical protein